VLLGDLRERGNGLKVKSVPVSVTVHLSRGGFGVKSTASLGFWLREVVLSGKESSSQRVECVEGDVEIFEAGKQFWLDVTHDWVVLIVIKQKKDGYRLGPDKATVGKESGRRVHWPMPILIWYYGFMQNNTSSK
jgi:hypothetical protein